MIWLYLINTCIAVGIVFAVIFPGPTRKILQFLHLWKWIAAVDARRFQRIVQNLGLFLVVAAVALFLSVLTGGHPLDWALPASEGLFFGIVLMLVAHWSGKKPPDSKP